MYKNIKLRFLDASFNVRKWKTNNPDLQNDFNKMENQFLPTSQPAFTCSKLTIETPEQGVKYVQS